MPACGPECALERSLLGRWNGLPPALEVPHCCYLPRSAANLRQDDGIDSSSGKPGLEAWRRELIDNTRNRVYACWHEDQKKKGDRNGTLVGVE
jgi:hypothetical protein